jgi:hypothetical protein
MTKARNRSATTPCKFFCFNHENCGVAIATDAFRMRPGCSGLAAAAVSFSDATSTYRWLAGERKTKTTILLIDSDLVFSFWLGQALDLAGHNALPVRNTSAAYELIQNHRVSVDTVIVNPLVPNAASFLCDLRKIFPSVSVVVALPEDGGRLFAIPECDIATAKPGRLTSEASLQWVQLLQGFERSRRFQIAQN